MNVKFLKLKKNEYYDLSALLKRAGLISKDGFTASPERLVVSVATEKKMKQRYRSVFKKQYPGASRQVIQYSVGLEFLNLGPRVSSAKKTEVIPLGYAVVLEEELDEP
jgi:hypothetical protein